MRISSEAVAEGLTTLREIVECRIAPAEARLRVERLAARHPGIELQLSWEPQAAGAIHYDLLLTSPGQETVSLASCPDRGVPWVLRGARRWSENALCRVGRTTLTVQEGIACLDLLLANRRIADHLVDVGLIRQELGDELPTPSDADLQEAVDEFRRMRGLLDEATTLRWMERYGASHERLERYAWEEALVARLRAGVVRGRVESYFEANRSSFDWAAVARLDIADADDAAATFEGLRAGTIEFGTEAERRLLRGEAGARWLRLRRRQAEGPLAQVFVAAPGDVIGPLTMPDGHAIVRVIAVERAQLDAATRHAVEQVLFDEWLAEKRRSTEVEWYWGRGVPMAR